MPTSHFNQLNEIMGLIIEENPKAILDCGVGFGKYGVLCYERFNIWGSDYYRGTNIIIDGIEGCKDYLTPLHDFIYHRIYIEKIEEQVKYLEGYKEYDVILLIDVLEHFYKGVGMEVIKDCLRIGKSIVFSTPKKVTFYPDAFGNKLEQHVSQWEEEDFKPLAKIYDIDIVFNTESLIGRIKHK